MYSLVKKAINLGSQNCHIVVFDWLEECLIRKNKLCRSERYWTLSATLKRLKKKGTEIDGHKKRFQNGVEASEEFTGQSRLTFPSRKKTRRRSCN
jgi:hypothetical protein